VTFAEDEQADIAKLEYVHNLVAKEVHPNPEDDLQYLPSEAMLFAWIISNIRNKLTKYGILFAQQYIMQKGLKLFGDRGHDGQQGNGPTTPKRLF
jgi:hypothetical protein